MKRDYGRSVFLGADGQGGQWQSCASVNIWIIGVRKVILFRANTGAYYPKPHFNTNKNQRTQTRYLQNAAYIRLKNMQIGYSLPRMWTQKVGMESSVSTFRVTIC